MTDGLQESLERLRRSTARLKHLRLKLPQPGAFLRVKYTAFLTPITSHDFDYGTLLMTHQCKPGTCLLLVAIDTQPEKDLIELIVLLPDENSLWKTGIRESQNMLAIYEVIG